MDTLKADTTAVVQYSMTEGGLLEKKKRALILYQVPVLLALHRKNISRSKTKRPRNETTG